MNRTCALCVLPADTYEMREKKHLFIRPPAIIITRTTLALGIGSLDISTVDDIIASAVVTRFIGHSRNLPRKNELHVTKSRTVTTEPKGQSGLILAEPSYL